MVEASDEGKGIVLAEALVKAFMDAGVSQIGALDAADDAIAARAVHVRARTWATVEKMVIDAAEARMTVMVDELRQAAGF